MILMKKAHLGDSLWAFLLLTISTTPTNTNHGECYWERSNLNSMGLIKTLTCSNVTMAALHPFTKNPNTLLSVNIFNSDIPTVDNTTFSFMGNSSKVVKLNFNNDKTETIEENALAAFSGLAMLSVSNNRLATVNFLRNQGQLQELTLSNNNISELHDDCFEPLRSLYLLDLSYNKLATLGNSTFNLPGLKRLYLNKNNISTLEPTPFQNNKLLVILNLEYNQLQRISKDVFGNLENLQELYLNDNLLSNVEGAAFQSLKNLWYLRLSNNKLEALTKDMFNGLINLEHLHLEGNQIQKIEPQSFSNLRTLSFINLRDNTIGILENRTFTGLQRLSLLNLTNLGIEEINPGSFTGLDMLQTLDLSSNKIETLEKQTFLGLSALENLLLTKNTISTIKPNAFSGLNRLIMLSIRDANISALEAETFGKMSALTTLELMSSDLRELQPGAFKGLHNLITLVLGNHWVADWKTLDAIELNNGTFWGLTKLKALYFKNLHIGTVKTGAFDGLADLRHLNLQNCTIGNLSTGAFYGLNRLSSIKACGNDQLAQHAMGKSYKLCGLSIGTIEPGAFEDLYMDDSYSYMHNSLYLSNNTLRALTANTFSRVSNMVELALDNNKIREIEVGAFNGLSFHAQPCSYATKYQEDREVKALTCNSLYLNNNTLRTLRNNTFSNVQDLVVLRLDFNAIEEVQPGAFDYLRFNDLNNRKDVFNTLYLNDNRLKSLRGNSLGKIQSLAVLRLDNNFIETIEPGTFDGLTFQMDSNAEVAQRALYLNNNKLTVLLGGTFRGIKNLRSLRLDFNNIKEIKVGAFDGLGFSNVISKLKSHKSARVNVLNLRYNKLTRLSKNAFTGIQNVIELNLDFNDIRTIEQNAFSNLNQIIILSLSNNNLDGLAADLFHVLPNLQTLDLSNNHILSINTESFSGLTSLKQLLISSNKIPDTPLSTFSNFPTLENLQLGDNHLSQFRIGIFSKLERLKYLNISHNNFSVLNENVLYPLRNLELLDLDDNGLTYINHSSLLMHLPSLRSISVNNNPWPCHTLLRMVKRFRQGRIHYLFNTTAQYGEANVDGISCVEVNEAEEPIPEQNENKELVAWTKQITQILEEWRSWQNNSTPTSSPDIVNLLNNISKKFDNLISLQWPLQKLNNWMANLSRSLENLENLTRSDIKSNSRNLVGQSAVHSSNNEVSLNLNPLTTLLVLLMSISSVTICLALIMTMCKSQSKKLKVSKLRKARSEMELLDTSA